MMTFHIKSFVNFWILINQFCVFQIPYSLELTLRVINAKTNFFALILGSLVLGGVNFGDLNFLEC